MISLDASVRNDTAASTSTLRPSRGALARGEGWVTRGR